MSAYERTIGALLARRDLSRAEAEAVMAELMDGALEPARIAALLTALAIKGECVDELVGFASVLRARAVPVSIDGPLLDTCGTGGSGLSTPNTSTLAAFVVAAAGVRVAKHGNRSSTGRCGSTDLLEAAGLPFDLDAAAVERLLRTVGLAFMLAPKFHPALRHAGPVRKALGFRSSFNFLGPLANPARARRQLLGVSDRVRAPKLAAALAALGAERALVVHGEDGLDELTLTGPSRAWWVEGGRVRETVIAPADAGLEIAPPEALEGGDRARNLALFLAVLEGRERGPVRDLVALNAGAALLVAERVASLAEGAALAIELLSSGAALAKLEEYRRAAA